MTCPATADAAATAAAYARDGVVVLRGALDALALGQALAAYEWSLANPGPGASRIANAGEAVFYNDLVNPRCLQAYRPMLQASPLPALIGQIWRAPEIWFLYEQVFLKDGGESRRTPWHQDSSYLAIAGDHLAVAWISFDPVAASEALEFVRGSHRGVLYNGSSFALEDDTAPLYRNEALPRLPNIEADRSAWDIVSWPTEPGDVVLFHPAMLHGGAPTHASQRRRTLTLRFFGRDARYDPRPGGFGAVGLNRRLAAGEPYRDPGFLQLAPIGSLEN